MIDDTLFSYLPDRATVVQNARMSNYTTFKLGGECPVLIDCPDAEVLADSVSALVSRGIEYLVIGQGSNLLVSDRGVPVVILRFCTDDMPNVEVEGGRVRVSGHTLLDDLARLTIEHGVGDVSFCSGIPGTVGGAIAGNAGAFGKQIGDVVESVLLLDEKGRRREVPGDELEFAYRTSKLKRSGEVVLYASLNLEYMDAQTMQAERDGILELRASKHPDWKTMPCAGSVFRNIEPTSAAGRRQAAGWFLEQAGAMTLKKGGARLFGKHANIIIADPGATARDVYELSEAMIAAVRDRFGFELMREIKLVGEF
jgi:UDP-N-acetylmuramate dehydrogenase